MDQPIERHVRFPGDVDAPAAARRVVRDALVDAALPDLVDDAVLLTSELCENAVVHASTGFELDLTLAGGLLTIAVTDHGITPMELRRGAAADADDRRSSHNRGLVMVDALATAWGSKHDGSGHQVWFTLGLRQAGGPEVERAPGRTAWPDVAVTRWLTHLPAGLARVTTPRQQVSELVRRLCEVLGSDAATVWVDDGDGETEWVAGRVAGSAVTVDLPLGTPRTGRIRVGLPADAARDAAEVVELVAQRIALVVESDLAGRADAERSSWLTFLAEAGELLNQSLDVQLVAAMVPQLVVPRLGRWCAVHLVDELGTPRLTGITHVDENQIPRLTELLTGNDAVSTLAGALTADTDTLTLGAPIDGVAVPLRMRRTTIGTLTVGRLRRFPHRPDQVMTICELGRRAAQAIDNAQRNAVEVATSRTLQQALMPRALPVSDVVEFAAAYLPISDAADVGGDFYDVVEIEDGRWLVCVGDVCGKGPRAAARTSMVRDVLRVLVRGGHPLDNALTLLHETMLDTGDTELFATMAAAMLARPSDGSAGLDVTLILAGHEQPVLARADGDTAMVGRHGAALGLVSDFTVHPTSHRLAPGDTLVFYTDGITEHRRDVEQFGQRRLLRTVAQAAGGTAHGTLTALRQAVEAFAPGAQRDDIVIMAVRAFGP